MSVYLNRSPYLTQSRIGSARKVFRKRRSVSSKQLWDNQSFSSSVAFRPRPSRRSSGAGFLSIFKKQTSQTAMRTGAAVRKSAETFSEVAQAVRNGKGKKVRFEFGPSMVIGSLLIMVALLSGAYLAHFNQVATKGYDLKRLEAHRQQLLNQYEVKNMQLAEMQSMTNIVKSEKADGMRRPSQVEYVKGVSAIAAR